MRFEDLDEYLFLNSNQYFIGHDNIEVKREVLQGLVKRALMKYGNYRPKIYRKYDFEITSHHMPIKEVDGRIVENIHEIYLIDPVYTNDPVPWHWEFDIRNKILYTPTTGTYIVDFLVRPILDDIDESDELFLDLMLGMYLMYIGEARKAFILDGLPFSNDASEIYSDGKELFDNAMELLREDQSAWYLAIK